MDPPSGIVPTTATLEQVLTAHAKAVGTRADPNDAVIEDETFTANGLSGTSHDVSYKGDYISTTTTGSFVTSEGTVDGRSWSEDVNGQVVDIKGVHERGEVDARALDDALIHPGENVQLLGEVASPISAYVVEVNPPSGRPQWIFFDKSTGLIDRTETVMPTSRIVESFADYKTSYGRMVAWSGHSSDGHPDNDTDWHVTSLRVQPSIARSLFARPHCRTFVEMPPGLIRAKLPAYIADGRIVITLTIGGRGYDFLLDSGASDITVDNSAAKQMGLTLYGKSQIVVGGQVDQSLAIIPEVNVGLLRLHNVAVDVLPFTELIGPHVKLVGLVGFDFIAGMELKVDYDNSVVTAFAPGQYAPPAGTYVIPALLDDGVPVVSAQVGSTLGESFIVDTGADKGYLFPHFAELHRKDVADEGLGRVLNEQSGGGLYSSTIGGGFQLTPSEVSRFSIGQVTFQDWMIYTLAGDYAQEEEDYDGLIGYDFLRFFNVVFDYADSTIYLEPNSTFRKNAR